MLLWEHLGVRIGEGAEHAPPVGAIVMQTRRLPYDTRCAAVTKNGKRCRGRVLPAGEWCVCHDPHAAARRHERAASVAVRRHRRLSHLPDGYLRKLSDRRSVGVAMDRLYREVRLGVVTPEMGRVLFDVLTRLLDSGLADLGRPSKAPARTKAERLRPKMAELLTRAERAAWRRAVERAPASVIRAMEEGPRIRPVVEKAVMEKAIRPEPVEPREEALKMPRQAAS